MKTVSKIGYDVQQIRQQFPILTRTVNGKPLIYFDNGATTQKPKRVIEAIVDFYSSYNSNIHRGVHSLSQESTAKYDAARAVVASFIHAPAAHNVIFTKGTTDSVNFVASCYGDQFVHEGDEILVTAMEHHSNILPWQELCKRKKAELKVLPVNDQGELRYDLLDEFLTEKTRMFAFAHVSNTLGTINDVKRLVTSAHAKSIPVLVDGAQAVPHLKVNVEELDADFYCFSGHKMYAPTGIGVLYAQDKWLDVFDPYQTGGGTIKSVTFEGTEYSEGPHKFEAGTPNVEGAIALAEAVTFMEEIGVDKLAAHEQELLEYATNRLNEIPGIKIIGMATHKAGVLSFNVGNIHPFDLGTLLDKQGIAVRTGHHCTQPLMQCYNIQGTVRVSFAAYNTKEEIDVFIEALKKAVKILS